MSRLRFASALAACAGGDGGSSTSTSTFSTGGTGGGSSGSGSSTGTGNGGSGYLFDAGTGGNAGGAGPGKYLIYASTDTDLFTLDPTDPALTLNHVGAFDCISTDGGAPYAMVDIAVNNNGDLWGITGHDAYPLTIQGTTVHCGNKVVLNGYSEPRFYALTFAPVGAIDPAKEVLVAGNTAGELWAYDEQAKKVVPHGNFGTVPAADPNGHMYPSEPVDAGTTVGKLWELSGDIVFLHNGGSPVGFATVRDCPNPPDTTGCSGIDTLIEIDMSKLAQPGNQNVTKALRGQLLDCVDPGKGYGRMYGIAAWDDKVYGFSRSGKLVQISNVDGSACLKGEYWPAQFSGAAVTTLAPVQPPPIK